MCDIEEGKYLAENSWSGDVGLREEDCFEDGENAIVLYPINVFKEKHHKEMGCPTLQPEKMVEENIVEDFCTNDFIEKEFAKIKNKKEGWQSRYIPELLGRVFSELVKEEMWNIVKKYKYPKINFKILNILVVQKIKEVKKEIFA